MRGERGDPGSASLPSCGVSVHQPRGPSEESRRKTFPMLVLRRNWPGAGLGGVRRPSDTLDDNARIAAADDWKNEFLRSILDFTLVQRCIEAITRWVQEGN